MKICEIFNSLSGESRFAGRRATFIRTFGCNCRCNYCDSLWSLEGDEYNDMSIAEIMDEVSKYDCKHVVYTGGEPLLQKGAPELMHTLLDNGYFVEIETNGAVDLDPFVFEFHDEENLIYTMDWKCPGSGMRDRMVDGNLSLLTSDDVVKCVVSDRADLDEMARISKLTSAQVFISPVFGRIEPREIAEYILENKMNDVRLQLQIHKYVWPVDMRGV